MRSLSHPRCRPGHYLLHDHWCANEQLLHGEDRFLTARMVTADWFFEVTNWLSLKLFSVAASLRRSFAEINLEQRGHIWRILAMQWSRKGLLACFQPG